MITLRSLPLIAAVVPFVGVTISYAIGTYYDLVPSCIPYIDGCTSISATGRYEPASFLFRAIQMPLGVLHIVIWLLCIEWLRAMGHHSRAAHLTLCYSGIVGGISLIIYVTFLGTQQPFYEFMRRFGIYGYFLGVAIAQVTLAFSVSKVDSKTVRFDGHRQGTPLVWLALLPFALGILNLVLKSILDDADQWENRIEWVAALIMQLYFLFLWNAWRVTGFDARVTSDVR
ncbi:MAG: hypothetical protein QNJ19_14325 [Woeseiaceae bacterium]|nr:hypothetical protein [Woeseiaceae bacterium]